MSGRARLAYGSAIPKRLHNNGSGAHSIVFLDAMMGMCDASDGWFLSGSSGGAIFFGVVFSNVCKPTFSTCAASTTPPDVKVLLNRFWMRARSSLAMPSMLNFCLGAIAALAGRRLDVGAVFLQHARAFLHAQRSGSTIWRCGRVRGVLHLRLRDAPCVIPGIATAEEKGKLFILLALTCSRHVFKLRSVFRHERRERVDHLLPLSVFRRRRLGRKRGLSRRHRLGRRRRRNDSLASRFKISRHDWRFEPLRRRDRVARDLKSTHEAPIYRRRAER